MFFNHFLFAGFVFLTYVKWYGWVYFYFMSSKYVFAHFSFDFDCLLYSFGMLFCVFSCFFSFFLYCRYFSKYFTFDVIYCVVVVSLFLVLMSFRYIGMF